MKHYVELHGDELATLIRAKLGLKDDPQWRVIEISDRLGEDGMSYGFTLGDAEEEE